MGVPKFFRWISERYPCLSEVVKEYQIPEFDNLYLDMNGIIHMCSHPNDFDPHFRITEEKIFKDIFHYIEVLFRMIQPQKLFFMAVDGVAPRAKMNQQRGRRFRSAKEAEVLEQKARERGEALPSEERFDSNCITPGTVFMARLHEQLKYFVVHKLSTDVQWQKVKVILSGHETPGEGEHKIMDYIRYMKSQPGYDPNTRHCLYGLDADLIMLGLCSHEPHFSLLREEVKFGRKAKHLRTSTPEETKFFLLHLSLMREYLELEFGVLKSLLPFPFDIEKIIDDWVLMGFLVGNDFIPPLPDMHIINGALPTLYKVYIQVLPTLEGYINEGGTLNLERFKKYMEKLSAFDFEQFRETYADLKYFQAKTGRRLGSKDRHIYQENIVKENDELILNENNGLRQMKNVDLATLIQNTEQELLSLSGEESDDAEDWEDFESDDEANANALFHLEFSQHKKDYYMNKLEYRTVNSEVLKSQADGYVRAIQWNLHYYYNGVCSWSWYYPHHYAPYISDICNFSEDLELKFSMGTPFLPFQQLLAVLPGASKGLLPVPYQQLMVEKESPIFHFYPSDFKTDLNGKKQEWEAVVLIPFIDEESLLGAMAPCDKVLTEEERQRNSHGPMLICTYTEKDLGQYEAPQYFPPIKNNHGDVQLVGREEISVDPKFLVKGLCPSVRLDVYFPGFPTLKHIPHTSSLQKCKVKVFEQPSQGSNMILQIVDQGKPDITEVATELIGHSIFVGWPHLIEAKVVAVSSKDSRYELREKTGIVFEETKGSSASFWVLLCKGIQENYATRLGVHVGETRILVHATRILGRKYIFGHSGKITLEKQWCDVPEAFALQTTVKDIAVHDRSFVQYQTLQELFPVKAVCFMLGHPHYGAMGEVVDGGTTVKSGRVKVSMSVTTEPNLDVVRKKQQDFRVQFMPGGVAAQRLGVSSHLVSRITGTIYIVQGDKISAVDHGSKVNVGLNLKFSKRNEEIPGYTRKDGTMWLYSNKAVDLVESYMQKFPELFDYLAKHTGNDNFYESDVFPTKGEDRLTSVTDIVDWLKEQPYTKLERHTCGSEILEEEFVKDIENLVEEFQQHGCRFKTVTMQVKPHLLYKPDLQIGNIAPDPSSTHRLFDRIVNVRASYTVPLGLKGTIIGIHHAENEKEFMYDVVFDKPFPGGLSLNCSVCRGYRLSKSAMLNLSHGQRVEQLKTMSKPTAVVQPSGIIGYPACDPWTDGRSIGGNANSRGSSAFASWNNSNQPSPREGTNIVPSHPPNIAAAQLYNAINKAGDQVPRGGFSAPPQPAFTSNTRQQSFKKISHQNFSNPLVNVSETNSSNITSPPTEFQAIWTQLQKANTSPQKPLLSSKQYQKEPISSPEVIEKSGTELLKKMLRISDDSSPSVLSSSASQPLLTTKQQNMKQVSVNDMFEYARVKKSSESKDVPGSYCIQLLNSFMKKGFGVPHYTYINNMEDGTVQAQVALPDLRTFSGDYMKSREQASESAAKVALANFSLDSSQSNESMRSTIGKPGTNTLPIPPQQWYQQQQLHNHHHAHRLHQQQQQQHFPHQAFHHQHYNRQDPLPDWRRRSGSEMTPTGGSLSGRPLIRQSHQHHPPPQAFMMKPFQSQQQPPHWPGSSFMNWRQPHQQQYSLQQTPGIRQQEPWYGGTSNSNWRQAQVEESQQFIPLQAVKQQRNKQHQGSKEWSQQQQQSSQSQSLQVEPSANMKETPVLEPGQPNTTMTKPVMSHPRKSRLAANFKMNVSNKE